MGRPIVGVIVTLEGNGNASAVSFAFDYAVELRQTSAESLKRIVAQEPYASSLGDSIVIMREDSNEVVVVFGSPSDDPMLITNLLAAIATQAGFVMTEPELLPLAGFAASMRARFGGQKEQVQ
jgi:hypothetical protein